MTIDIKELKALISLLDDSDNEVINVVSSNLLNQGPEAIPELEKAWETTLNEQLQERLENVIQKIQFTHAKKNLQNWVRSGAENILEGAVYLAQFQFPELSFEAQDKEIEKIRKDVWLEINNNLTALEKIKVINYIIFEIHKFKRNSTNFYSPQNSFINQVLETKRGNPISLAIVYLAVAQKLNLPIYGVNLPKNFILAYKDEYRQHDSEDEKEDILFYINPYNKGAVLGRREIDYFIKQQQLEQRQEYYVPCSNSDIMVRLINNLILSYKKLDFTEKIERLQELLGIF
ncbi:MAG: transglutaminase family protein [Bacteroidales bacterium]|nr:transglutaminase family protein [Bacteroidales bacterium]